MADSDLRKLWREASQSKDPAAKARYYRVVSRAGSACRCGHEETLEGLGGQTVLIHTCACCGALYVPDAAKRAAEILDRQVKTRDVLVDENGPVCNCNSSTADHLYTCPTFYPIGAWASELNSRMNHRWNLLAPSPREKMDYGWSAPPSIGGVWWLERPDDPCYEEGEVTHLGDRQGRLVMTIQLRGVTSIPPPRPSLVQHLIAHEPVRVRLITDGLGTITPPSILLRPA